MIEEIAATLVGAALLWLVAQPLIAPGPVATVVTDFTDPEETPRGQALLALKEIEFDRATGKLSDSDYAFLNAKYSAAAIAILEEAPIAVDGVRCLGHGARTEAGAIFCAECGNGLVTATGSCLQHVMQRLRPTPLVSVPAAGCGCAT